MYPTARWYRLINPATAIFLVLLWSLFLQRGIGEPLCLLPVNRPAPFPHLSLYSVYTNVIHWIWNHFQLKSMNATISPGCQNLGSIWIKHKKWGGGTRSWGTKLDLFTPRVSLLPRESNRLNPWCCRGFSSVSYSVPDQISPKPERSKNQWSTPSD